MSEQTWWTQPARWYEDNHEIVVSCPPKAIGGQLPPQKKSKKYLQSYGTQRRGMGYRRPRGGL